MQLQVKLLCLALISTASVVAGVSQAATFPFGSSQNGLDGQSTVTLTAGAFQMKLDAGIAGSKLNEPEPAGLGINSTSLAATGVSDSRPALLNILGGSGPLAGAGESVVFSFDRPGIITGLNFDGVKDESLEYFILTSSGGVRVNFFDSAANTTIVDAVTSAVTLGAVTGDVKFLLEINDAIDDEAQNLSIPFVANQQFTLTFAALGAVFGPTEASNGARFQGISVQSVPEPASVLSAFVATLPGWSSLRRRRGTRKIVFALK